MNIIFHNDIKFYLNNSANYMPMAFAIFSTPIPVPASQ